MSLDEKMILASVKRSLTIVGVIPVLGWNFETKLRKHQLLLNIVHISFMLISLTTYTSSVMLFLFFKAESFLEFAEAAFFSSVTFLHVSSYVLLIQSRSKLFDLIKESEKTVLKSESGLFRDTH